MKKTNLWIPIVIVHVALMGVWGAQGYVMRFANETMKAESIFFYMMVTSVLLIPLALLMTDFSKPINMGFKGPYLAAMVQILNAFGALCLTYAYDMAKR